MLGNVTGPLAEKIVNSILRRATRSGKVCFSKELRAIAKRSAVDVRRITLLNLSYEAAAHCT